LQHCAVKTGTYVPCLTNCNFAKKEVGLFFNLPYNMLHRWHERTPQYEDIFAKWQYTMIEKVSIDKVENWEMPPYKRPLIVITAA